VSKPVAPLIAVYAVVATLVLVGAPLAAEPEEPNPATSGEPAQSGDAGVEAAQPTTPTPNPQQHRPQQNAAPEQETTPEEPPPVAVAAGPGSVSIADFSFSPGTITVNAGDTVTWTNTGKESHTATGSSFDTGLLSRGESGSHTFGSAGSFSYVCTPHPFMKGTVVVRAASSGRGSGGNGSSGGGAGGAGGAGGSGSDGSQGSSASGGVSGASSGSALPASGADAWALAILGVMLFGLGFAIRRRAASAS
jgi:plastocyanin